MTRPTLLTWRRRASCFVGATALLLAAPRAHGSDSLTAEMGGGLSKPTPTIPSAPFEYQKIGGRYEPFDALSLSASMRLTHDFAAAPTDGTVLRTRSDWVWNGTLGGSLDASKHITLGLDLNGSPTARRDIATPLSYPPSRGNSTTVYSSMKTNGWNAGVSADVQYDTYDDEAERDLDVSVDAALGFTHFGNKQVLAAIDEPAAVVDVQALAARCAGKSTPDCQAYGAAAQEQSASLNQFRLGTTVVATMWERTDLGVDLAYYLYDRGSPGDPGFFTAPITGGGGNVIGSASWGAGLPVLPPRFTVRPELGHRWDAISVRAYYQFARYAVVPDEVGHTVGGKVQIYAGKWRPYLTGNVREDLAGGSAGASSWSVGAGLQRVF